MARYECAECGKRREQTNMMWYAGQFYCLDCGGKLGIDPDPYYNQWLFDGAEDDDDMPEGCSACGGDWPNCTTSCPLYDE